MENLIRLLFPFFYTTKDYDELLQKLASFAFWEVYFITLFLRENPTIDSFFSSGELWGPIGKIIRLIPGYEVLNISGFAMAIAVALLTHMIQLHDRISDVLGIRRRFDRKSILIPLAKLVGVSVTKGKKAKIAGQRDELMRAVFYRYASSRSPNPVVDKHDIEHALNAWSWFWAALEGIFYFGIGAIVAWWFESRSLALTFGIVTVSLLVLALLQRLRLGRYARPQIQSIAADPTAAHDVRAQFNAL